MPFSLIMLINIVLFVKTIVYYLKVKRDIKKWKQSVNDNIEK